VLKPNPFDTSINSGKTPLDDPEKEGEE
jgi:hypothetical protein